jgi:hypothetical protein
VVAAKLILAISDQKSERRGAADRSEHRQAAGVGAEVLKPLAALTSLSLPWSFHSRPLQGAARHLSHIIRRLHVIHYFFQRCTQPLIPLNRPHKILT